MNLKIIEKIGLDKIRRHCTVDRGRHVAFAFLQSGHILCVETNRRSATGNITPFSVHAEEFLIKKLRKMRVRERLGIVDILVVRWDKMGGWKMSKPCEKCENMMRKYGVRRIFYSGTGGDIILNLP